MADTEIQEPPLVSKKFNFEDDDLDHLDHGMPIISFRQMLKNNRRDLVDVALNEMVAYIENRAMSAISKEDMKHLLDCIRELRIGCIEQKEEDYWDHWLEKCQSVIGEETFKILISQGLGYLKKSNEDMYKP